MANRRIASVVAALALIVGIKASWCLGFSTTTAPPRHHRFRRPTSSSSSAVPPPPARHRASSARGISSDDDPGADDMFAKFDRDGNGLIDRDEFRAVARTMRASSRRREVLSVATASFGSVFVASGSSTFQFAQKRFRSAYLEEYAEAAQAEMFPTAMLSGDLDRAVARVLRSRGFAPENTLFGHSVCADEVNNRREQLLPLMVNRWQEGEISEISAHFVLFVSLLKIPSLSSSDSIRPRPPSDSNICPSSR